MKVLTIAAIVIGAAALAATGIGLAAGFTLGSTLGAIGGVAGAIGLTGVAATAFTGIIVAAALYDIMLGVNAILPKPSQGGAQTKWKADPYAGLPYVMGRTLVGGNVILRRGHGSNNMYETFVTVLCVCTAASIDTTFLNKTTTSFDGGGAATGTYNGQVWQRQQLGLYPEPAALSSPVGNPEGWTASHKLSGLAATMLTFKYDTRQTNGLTSEPSPAWIGHWVKVYDPRLDSTYPGGSGACRAYDESTYVWSENPHLHGLTWAMGRYQNGVRVAGIGTSAAVPGGVVKGIDIASFVEGANLDDARHWTLGGQVVTRPDTLWNSLKSMLQAGGAQPTMVGGIITSINSAPRVSLATITRDDIVGKCTFTGTQARRARLNGIIPQYRSEAHDWEMVSAEGVSIPSFVTLDGDERTKEVTYPLVQDVNQVAQLATYDIYASREAGPGSIPLKPWWLNYKVGDCVTFAPEDDFTIKTLITGRAIEAQSGVVTYTIRGETDGKHSYALNRTGIAPPIVSLAYDTHVAAPSASDWSLTGTTQSVNGNAIPALLLSGGVTNPNAEAVIVEISDVSAMQNDDGTVLQNDDGTTLLGDAPISGWTADSTLPPTTTSKVISGVVSTGVYQVAVSYRVRGVQGGRLVLGPVTAGQLMIPGVATSDALAGATATIDQQAQAIAGLRQRLADANIP